MCYVGTDATCNRQSNEQLKLINKCKKQNICPRNSVKWKYKGAEYGNTRVKYMYLKSTEAQ